MLKLVRFLLFIIIAFLMVDLYLMIETHGGMPLEEILGFDYLPIDASKTLLENIVIASIAVFCCIPVYAIIHEIIKRETMASMDFTIMSALKIIFAVGGSSSILYGTGLTMQEYGQLDFLPFPLPVYSPISSYVVDAASFWFIAGALMTFLYLIFRRYDG